MRLLGHIGLEVFDSKKGEKGEKFDPYSNLFSHRTMLTKFRFEPHHHAPLMFMLEHKSGSKEHGSKQTLHDKIYLNN